MFKALYTRLTGQRSDQKSEKHTFQQNQHNSKDKLQNNQSMELEMISIPVRPNTLPTQQHNKSVAKRSFSIPFFSKLFSRNQEPKIKKSLKERKAALLGELQPPEGGGFNLRLESRLSC
ncbi:MAG: hypothetical protein GY782_05215 [Gammaproteobacteria bacterium]|nr:hypothetical protein [Gammaproteobacteria bacterium]